MKTIKIFNFLLLLLLTAIGITAQNTNPVVTNVAFSISGTTVTVTYDVTDAEESIFTISMEVSSDNGTTWGYNYGTATGAIGSGITEGAGKTIIWTYEDGLSNQFKIKIIANDEMAGGSPCPGTPTVTYSGKTYNTVQIGDQCWLKENLDVGTIVHSLRGGPEQTNNGTIEKYCYENNETNCETYGGLYQWNEAMQYSTTEGVQGICPSGWHIPTLTEQITLSSTVGGSGNALKAVGQGTGVAAGTNTSGFSGLLAGYREPDRGNFSLLDDYTSFWSSTGYPNGTDAYNVCLHGFFYDTPEFSYIFKYYGLSVRCLKD